MSKTINMPPPQSTTSFLDLLPDEILESILYFAVDRDHAFLMEKCMKPVSKKTGRLDWHTQSVHLRDWRMVNSTNRRIRRVGKEVFFRAKTFVMSTFFADRLHRGPCGALSGADRALALANIESLVITEQAEYRMLSPTALLVLPARVRPFPRLRRVVLSPEPYYSTRGDELRQVRLLVPGGEREEMPQAFRDLMLAIGFPEGVEPEVAAPEPCRFRDRPSDPEYLEQIVYPILRVRALLLKRVESNRKTASAMR